MLAYEYLYAQEGFFVNLEFFMEYRVRMGHEGLIEISGMFSIVFFWDPDAGSSGMPFGHCLRHLFGWIIVLGGLQ